MNTPSIVDVLIQNITQDQALLHQADQKIAEAKEEKVAVVDRLKDYRKELVVILKYATDEQKEKIEALGFDTVENSNGLNAVATLAFDLIAKAKDNKLTNLEWYNKYVATFKDKEEAVNYTAFNIKCRPLLNSQRLIRTKTNGSSSYEDIISLNGSSSKKKESKDNLEKIKKTSELSHKTEPIKTIALKKGTLNKKNNDTTPKQK